MKEKNRVGRSSLDLKMFKNFPYETDWAFRQRLAGMSVGGAELGECLYIASNINPLSVESWITEWGGFAKILEEQADRAIERGHLVSAREAYMRAWYYYSAAEYGCGGAAHPQFHTFWKKSVDCFQKAGSLFPSPIRPVEVPFENKKLPGYFWAPDNSGKKRPTLFAAGGNESSIEQILMSCGPAAINRGYNFFIFDYPGHRGAVHLYPELVKRYDQEIPFKAAFDYLQTLPGVDERIALTGFSWGGYVVIRVAAYENRVKALIPNAPMVDYYQILVNFYKPIFDLKKKHVSNSIIEYFFNNRMKKNPLMNAMIKFSFYTWGDESLKITDWLEMDCVKKVRVSQDELKNIHCPVLALLGKNEGEIFKHQTHQFINGISSNKKDVYVFTLEKDGCSDHCQIDNRSRSNSVMLDWLDELFLHSCKPSDVTYVNLK